MLRAVHFMDAFVLTRQFDDLICVSWSLIRTFDSRSGSEIWWIWWSYICLTLHVILLLSIFHRCLSPIWSLIGCGCGERRGSTMRWNARRSIENATDHDLPRIGSRTTGSEEHRGPSQTCHPWPHNDLKNDTEVKYPAKMFRDDLDGSCVCDDSLDCARWLWCVGKDCYQDFASHYLFPKFMWS